MAVWSRAAEIKTLVDLNLAVRYGIVILYTRIHSIRKYWRIFNLAVVAKFNSPPNFPAIRYSPITSDMQGIMWGEPDFAGITVREPGNVAEFSSNKLAYSYSYEHISNE